MTARKPLIVMILLSNFFMPLSAAADSGSDAVESWQDMKFGMFIHWGLYSIAGGVWKGERVETGYSEQIMAWAPASREEYAELAGRFSAEEWDPDAVCELAKAAGMRYIVLTSKHHDGFCLFKTSTTSFNSVEMTPLGEDVVKGLADACRRHGLKLGVYYSLIDWSHPRGNTPEPSSNSNPIPPVLERDILAQLEELLTGYGDLVEIWFDMSTPTPRQSRRFADKVRGLQPGCLVSGRIWNHQGDFTVMGDNQIPNLGIREPWQSPESIYSRTWGYRSWQERDDLEGKVREKIRHLSRVVSLGGVYLLNIGPRGDGSIVDFEAEVLKGIGKWMDIHAEAVTGTTPQPFFETLPWGFATNRGDMIYLHVHDLPSTGVIELPGLQSGIGGVEVMSSGSELEFFGGTGEWRISTSNLDMKWPVEVIEVELESPLLVLPPLPSGDLEEGLRLTMSDVYLRRDRNGRGYFEQPVTSGYTWDFSVPAEGSYEPRVEVFRPEKETVIEILFNGERSVHLVKPEDAVRDIILVSPGRFEISPDQPCRLTVQALHYVPGTPVGVSVAGMRLIQ